MPRYFLTLSALGAGMVACGLAVVGTPPDDEPSPDASRAVPDGASTPDADPLPAEPDSSASEAGPAGCNPDACALPAPVGGFALALFGDTAQACPANFAATDVVENPVAGAGACTCGDCSAPIDCSMGTIPTKYDQGNGTCGTAGASLAANNGACVNLSATWGTNASIEAPAPVVGACSAPGVPARTAVTTTAKRICTPDPAACTALACTPPPGMAACVVHDGDVACPAEAPNKHRVGSDFSVACASCGCMLNATCTGKLEAFPQQDCAGSPMTVVPNACTNMNGARFGSFKWTGMVAQQSCTKGAAPPATVALADVRTVCCR